MALVGVLSACTRSEDDGVDEIEMAIRSHQHVVWNSVEDVVVAICEIVHFLVKTNPLQFVVDFLLGSLTFGNDKRLTEQSTYLTVTVLCKA